MRTQQALCLPVLLVSFLAAVPACSATSAGASAKAPAPCTAAQLSLALDAENGSFDGMSHSGTLLVLRNLGPSACQLGAWPQISLADATGALPVHFAPPSARFLHPGPVVPPVIVAPEAELTSKLRWVSGPVFTENLCLHPTQLSVTVGGEALHAPLAATLCGEKQKGVQAEMTRLVPDPTASPCRHP